MGDEIPVVDQSPRVDKIHALSERVGALIKGERLEDKVSVLVTALVNETMRSPLVFSISDMVHQAVGAAFEQLCACEDCKRRRQTS